MCSILVVSTAGGADRADALTPGAIERVTPNLFLGRSWVSQDLDYLVTGPESPGPLTRYSLNAGTSTVFSLPGTFTNADNQVLSGDGLSMLYATDSALVGGDTDAEIDSYRYRISDGQLTLLSTGAAGGSVPMAASGDAGVVLLNAFIPGRTGLWRVDVATGTAVDLLEIVPGERPFGYAGTAAALSADGRYAAFVVAAEQDCSACVHTYTYDATTGTVSLVDSGAGGLPANANVGGSVFPQAPDSVIDISADGRHVLFHSMASDLIGPSSTPNAFWVRDLDTGKVQQVSRPSSTNASISGDGRRVVYDAGQIGDPGFVNVYGFDRADLTVDTGSARLSPLVGGFDAANHSTISRNGSSVLFYATSDLVGDGGGGGFFRRTLPAAPPIPPITDSAPPLPTLPPAFAPLHRVDGSNRELFDASSDGRLVLTGSSTTRIVRRVDRESGAILSVSLPRAQGEVKALTRDGSELLFSSIHNLTPDDLDQANQPAHLTNNDVYAYRFTDGRIRLLTGGVTFFTGGFDHMATSSNGRYLITSTYSFFNGHHTYWIDTLTHTWLRLEDTAGAGESRLARMSSDGRFVAFNAQGAVYRFDATTGNSVAVDPFVAGDGQVASIAVSGDGQWVAIGRMKSGPVLNWSGPVYRKRLVPNSVREAIDPDGATVSISADGGLVSFAKPRPDSSVDVIVRDLDPAVPALITGVVSAPTGVTAHGQAHTSLIAVDGSSVFFTSPSTDLAPGDTVADNQIYMVKLGAPIVQPPPVDPTPLPPPPSPPAAPYSPVAPKRLLDTRLGGSTLDHQFEGGGLQRPAQKLELQVTGRANIPVGTTTAVLNITVTGPTGNGYLTAWPCDTPTPPNASNLNYVTDQTIPNLVIAPLSPRGTVCLQTTEAATHILADINGYYPADAGYTPTSPKRLLDTRAGGTTADAKFAGSGQQQPGTRLELQVTGRSGIPVGAIAAVLNITVADPTGIGYLTAWPCDTPGPPNASNLNYVGGQTIPNVVIAPLSPSGSLCLQTSEAAAHVLADINGYYPADAGYTPIAPRRLLDTRDGGTTTDAKFAGGGLQQPGQRLILQVTGRGLVPAGATAAVLNITVTGPTGNGYLTAWPCDSATPPNASNLNFVAGQTIPNLVIAPLSPSGTVCLQTSEAAAHILADVNGYVPSG